MLDVTVTKLWSVVWSEVIRNFVIPWLPKNFDIYGRALRSLIQILWQYKERYVKKADPSKDTFCGSMICFFQVYLICFCVELSFWKKSYLLKTLNSFYHYKCTDILFLRCNVITSAFFNSGGSWFWNMYFSFLEDESLSPQCITIYHSFKHVSGQIAICRRRRVW